MADQNFTFDVQGKLGLDVNTQQAAKEVAAFANLLKDTMSKGARQAIKAFEHEFKTGARGAADILQDALEVVAKQAGKKFSSGDLFGPLADQAEQAAKRADEALARIGKKGLQGNTTFGGGSFLGSGGAGPIDPNDLLRQVRLIQAAFNELMGDLHQFGVSATAVFDRVAEAANKATSKEMVGMQEVMSERRAQTDLIIAQMRQQDIATRQSNTVRNLAEREAMAQRAAMRKRDQGERTAELKQDNLILNSYLQQQVVKTKESLDRRQQFQRFFLDSTRSTFRTATGAVSTIWQGMYNTLGNIANRGEGGLLNIVMNRSKQRNNIYESEMRQRQQTMMRFSDQGNKGVIGALAGTSQLGGMMRNVAMAGGGAIGLTAVFKLGSEFQEQLRVTAALTNATESEFQALRKASIDLGNDITLPGVSAGQAAEAMGLLARSGFSVKDSISATKGVLSLARGAQLDFGQAATIVGKSLNVFGIEAKNATQVADAFSGALAQAPQSMTDIQNAVARGANAFVNMQKGVDGARNNMEKFLATSSYLIKATGRSGEEVGTGMKRFFEVFQNPSKPAKIAIDQLSKAAGLSKNAGNIMFEANGKARKFEETVGLLQKGVSNLGTEQQRASVIGQIFGSEASAIAMALADQEFSVGKAQIRIRQLGDSAKIAAARNAGLKGALDALKSQFETFAILIFEKVNKPLGNLVTGIAKLVDAVANGGGVFAMLRTALLGVAAGLGAVLAAKGIVELFQYMKIGVAGLMTPFGILALAAAGIGAAFAIAYKQSEPFRGFVEQAKETVLDFGKNLIGKVADSIVGFGKLIFDVGKNLLSPLIETFKAINNTAEGFGGRLKTIFGAVGNLISVVVDQITEAFKGGDVGGIFGAIGRAGAKAYAGIKAAFDAILDVVRWAGREIRQAWDAGGILGVITAPFKGIKNFFVGVFKDVQWGEVFGNVLNGIRVGFAAVGRRIGLILGSNEFRNTLLVAFGVLGGVIGSAALGLVEGLIDGLRKSELGKKVVQALKDLINPMEFIKALFGALTGDPASIVGMILRGGLLVALALLVKKIKEIFEKGTTGLQVAFKFATGDQAGANKLLEETKKKTLEAEKATARFKSSVEAAFGSGLVSKLIGAGNAVSGFGAKLQDANKKLTAFADERNLTKPAALATIIREKLQPTIEKLAPTFDKAKTKTAEAMTSMVQSVQSGLMAAGIGIREFAVKYGEMRANRKVDAGAVIRDNFAGYASAIRDFGSKVGVEIGWLKDNISKKLDDARKAAGIRIAFFAYEFSKSDRGRAIIDFSRDIAQKVSIGTRLIVDRVKQFANDTRDVFQIGGLAITDGSGKLRTATESQLVPAFKNLVDKIKSKANDPSSPFRLRMEQFASDMNKAVDGLKARTAPIASKISDLATTVLGKTSDFAQKAKEWTTTAVKDFRTALSNGFGKDLAANLPEIGGLGAATGGGIAAVLVGNNPAAQMAGLVTAILGVTQAISVAKATAQAFNSTLAGVATGGVFVVFAALTAAVGYFAKKQMDAKAAAEKFKSNVESTQSVLNEFTQKTGYVGRDFELEFTKRIIKGSSETFKSIRKLGAEAGFSAGEIAKAFTTDLGIANLGKQIDKQIANSKKKLDEIRLIQSGQSGNVVMEKLPGDIGILEKTERLEQDRYNNLKSLKAAYNELSTARKNDLKDSAIMAELEQKSLRLAQSKRTELEKSRDKTRELTQATDELAQALFDALNPGRPKVLQQTLDDAAAASENLFGLLRDNKLTVQDVLSGSVAGGAREARDALEGVEKTVAGVVASITTTAKSQGDFNTQLDAAKQKLIDNAVAQGANKQLAADLFTIYFEGYKNLGPSALGFALANQKALSTVEAAIGGVRDKLRAVVKSANIGEPLKASLNTFLAAPSDPKNIKTMLDLGVSQEVLAAFIADPSEKTIAAILATGQFAGQVATATAPVTKPVTPVITNPSKPVGLELLKRPVVKPAIGKITNPDRPVGLELLKRPVDKPTVAKITNPTNPVGIGFLQAPTSKPVNAFVPQSAIAAVNSAATAGARKPVDLYVNNADSFSRSVKSLSIFGIKIPLANGGVITRPTSALVGEAGAEVVIPLTKPKRAVELYQQSGLEKVLAAGGLSQTSQGMPSKTSNVTVNQTFNVNGDTNLRKSSRKAMAAGYDLGRQLRGI